MEAADTYRKFAQYYDVYVQDLARDLAFYKSFCYRHENILEVGCGTGRVLKSFLEDGFCMVGADISQEMLDIAQEKLAAFYTEGKLRLVRHNLMDKPLFGRFDKVFVTFYTFNYILEKPDVVATNIFRSMAEEALLVMDLFYPKTLANPALENIWQTHEFRYDGRVVQMKDKRSFANDLEKRVQIYQEKGEQIEITTTRKYYPPEAIKQILETAGFQEIMFSETYDKNHFKETIDSGQLIQNFVVKTRKQA